MLTTQFEKKQKNKDITLYVFIFFTLLILLFSLYKLYQVLLPFIIGCFLAYFLIPTYRATKKYVTNSSIASVISIVLAITIFVSLFSFIMPTFYKQLQLLYRHMIKLDPEQILQYLENAKIFKILPNHLKPSLAKIIDNIPILLTKYMDIIIKQIMHSTSVAFEILIIIFISPFTAFFLLRDSQKISINLMKIIPIQYKNKALSLVQKINQVFLEFLQGQLQIAFILALYYSATFKIIKLESAISLGVITGILSIIPYAGAIASTVLILLITLMQFGIAIQLLLLLIIFLIGHLLESLYLSPKILGDKLGLHPVITVMSILINAKLFGLIGMFFALPLTVLIMMFINLILSLYQKKLSE